MTRLFLAAGVAALAIAIPATAKPPEGRGGGSQAQAAPRGGGGGGGARAQAVMRGGGGGGGGPRMQAFARGGGGGGPRMESFAPRGGGGPRFEAAPRMQRSFAQPRAERFAMPRQERTQRFATPQERRFAPQRTERQSFARAQARGQTRMAEREQIRASRTLQARNRRQEMRTNRIQLARNERQQLRASDIQQAQNNHALQHQQFRANNMQLAHNNQPLQHQQMHDIHMQQAQNNRALQHQRLGANNVQMPHNNPALAHQQLLTSHQLAKNGSGILSAQQLQTQRMALNNPVHFNQLTTLQSRIAAPLDPQRTRFTNLTFGAGTPVYAPTVVEQFVGAPISTVATVAALSPLPPAISYLYPDTPDYYYRYGDGYLYEVNRNTDLVAAMLPLLAGGYLPGQFLPNNYMSSYVPADYGFNAFYPDYGDDCYRYGDGVVYDVDCETGFVEDVIPLYAGGYGVGQILPTSYAYYNVPYQYRSVYYDTPDSNYWYAPGAIYQYSPHTSMITSVAALLSPGFTIGQPLPAGYDVYNVPMAYRATYYDTPAAWYRYNNGYIYRVDPSTMLVTAIAASLLT